MGSFGSMKWNELGQTGIKIAPIVFGGNVFGWTLDEAGSFNVLDAFVDSGFNCIDTADIYSRWKPGNMGGESETIIGKWLKSKGGRDKLVIATKVGSDMGQNNKGLSKAWIEKAVENSLRRLQTDYIDLYQSHMDDHDVPVFEPLEAYASLIKAGKVRIIGASNFSLARLNEAKTASEKLGLPNYTVLQPEYNLYDRSDYETEYEAFVKQNQISVISYFSLAKGFLTGKYRNLDDTEKSVRGGGVKRYFTDKGHNILAVLDRVAEEQNCSLAAISLAWLLTRPGITAPIASATSISQWLDLAKATAITLNTEQLIALENASAGD